MYGNKTLVVAHYNEDLGWLEGVPKDVHVHVVEKGEPSPVRRNSTSKRPNIGREPDSYLSYIVDNYEHLEGEYFFTQGKPFDHCLEFSRYLELGLQGEPFKWLGNTEEWGLMCFPDGKPQHEGLDLHRMHRVFNKGELPTKYAFKPGCIVAVTADRIKQHDKPIYEKLLSMVQKDDYEYAFERLVGYLFSS